MIFNDFPVAGRNPFRLLHRCELAMDEYLPRDAADTSSSVLRVLLTKVSRRPPFLMGEVVSQFRSWEELFFVLRASCHIPVVGGLLPYPIPDHGWFYDGLLWSSLFVPWRTFGRQDSVFKISPLFVWADIRPSALVPLWWAIFPPSTDALLGLLMLGYKDAQDWSARLEQGGGARWARLRDRMKPVREQCSRLDADGLRLIKALHAEVRQILSLPLHVPHPLRALSHARHGLGCVALACRHGGCVGALCSRILQWYCGSHAHAPCQPREKDLSCLCPCPCFGAPVDVCSVVRPFVSALGHHRVLRTAVAPRPRNPARL